LAEAPVKNISRLGAAPDRHVDVFRETRRQLEQAEAQRKQRNFDRAESICSLLVRHHPDYFGALHTLGLIYADKRDYRRAVGYLAQAAMLNPRSWMTLTALAGVYLRLDAPEMAARTLEQARTLRPKEPSILVTLGEIYREEREYELARHSYGQALEVDAGMKEAAIGLALTCALVGRYAEASDLLDRLLSNNAPSLSLLAALAGLPPSFVRKNLITEIDKVKRSPEENKSDFENGLAFLRAAALDQAGRYADAWGQAITANRVTAATINDALAAEVIRERANLGWLRTLATANSKAISDERQPISLFILGPSRSGKTTMESLVSILDGVKCGYENPSLENAISLTYRGAGLLTAYSLEHLPPQFYPQVRDVYMEELARRAGVARVFTNTHPAYIHDAARLAALLPNVRFIIMQRNVDETVLRVFMRAYRRANYYAYDIKSAYKHIEWYYEMGHVLAEKFPAITRVIRYEDMVSDPAAALGIAAELCGLPMTDKPLPQIGDDRGCAESYREFMSAALAG